MIFDINSKPITEGLFSSNKNLLYYISEDKNQQFNESLVFANSKKKALRWYLDHYSNIKYREIKDSEYASWFDKTTELIINNKFRKDLNKTVYVFGATPLGFDKDFEYGVHIKNMSLFHVKTVDEITVEELIKLVGIKLTVKDIDSSEISNRKRISMELRKQFGTSINKPEFKKLKDTKSIRLSLESSEMNEFINCDSDELIFIKYDLNKFYNNKARLYMNEDGAKEYSELFKAFMADICNNKNLNRLSFHCDGDWDDGTYSAHIHDDVVDKNSRLVESYFDIDDITIKGSCLDINALTEASLTSYNGLYPIYVVLFSNDTDFGKMIRNVTGSPYSHATVTLDPSLNDMYSFSDIPFNHDKHFGAGFVRESIYSPMYRKNRYFTILVTFTNKEGIKNYKDKLEKFKKDYTDYKYNDIGLLQYYLNFKNTKDTKVERRKMRWFCSEFVTLMLSKAGIEGFEDVLQAPGDLRAKKELIEVGDYTLKNFSEKDLRNKTKSAYTKYLAQHDNTNYLNESYSNIIFEHVENQYSQKDIELLMEAKLKDGVAHENDVTKYTAMLDWGYLYKQFKAIFPDTDPSVRFDLFEIIVRDYIVPLRLSVQKTVDTIIAELLRIKQSVVGNVGKIIGASVEQQTISVKKSNRTVDVKYPDLIIKK